MALSTLIACKEKAFWQNLKKKIHSFFCQPAFLKTLLTSQFFAFSEFYFSTSLCKESHLLTYPCTKNKYLAISLYLDVIYKLPLMNHVHLPQINPHQVFFSSTYVLAFGNKLMKFKKFLPFMNLNNVFQERAPWRIIYWIFMTIQSVLSRKTVVTNMTFVWFVSIMNWLNLVHQVSL